MPLKCQKGTSTIYRWKTTKTGKRLRLGGCAKKGRFIKDGVKEVKVVSPQEVVKKISKIMKK